MSTYPEYAAELVKIGHEAGAAEFKARAEVAEIERDILRKLLDRHAHALRLFVERVHDDGTTIYDCKQVARLALGEDPRQPGEQRCHACGAHERDEVGIEVYLCARHIPEPAHPRALAGGEA